MTTKKTIKTKPVKRLTAAQKRVLIAEDTIAWLNTKAIKAKRGNYFKAPASGIKVKGHDDKLDVALATTKKPCQVCALGGMFYSMVRRFDKVTVGIGDINSRLNGEYFIDVGVAGIFDELGRYFSHHQLAMIESAFETTDMFEWDDYDHIDEATADKAIKFALKMTPAGRLRKIMNNIIENKGVFEP